MGGLEYRVKKEVFAWEVTRNWLSDLALRQSLFWLYDQRRG